MSTKPPSCSVGGGASSSDSDLDDLTVTANQDVRTLTARVQGQTQLPVQVSSPPTDAGGPSGVLDARDLNAFNRGVPEVDSLPMATPKILQRLYSIKTSSPDFPHYLHSLIQSDREENYLCNLQGPALTRLVDFLDRALGVAPTADDIFRQCLHKLQAICSHHRILPSSHIITGGLIKVGEYPVASGGFADVWEGKHESIKVCIKCPKITVQNRGEIEKAFYREAIMWKRFRHRNIVRFIGVTQGPLQFVSEWMPNGTLRQYLAKNPDADRIDLLLGVAEGLAYLHAKHTTHGDLKGPNILIDHGGRACLTDFGFSSVVRGLNSVLVTKVQGYSTRWAAPEVIMDGDRITREADVYSFSMVVIEAFTGTYPFSELANPMAVLKILGSERPDRPQDPDLSDQVWDMTVRCWRQDPARRPKMKKVVATLQKCHRSSIATSQLSTDSELSSPPSLRHANRAHRTNPKPRTTQKRLASPGFEDACIRIDRVAERIATRGHKSGWKDIVELRQLCGDWRTVPTLYQLEGVIMEGGAQYISQTAEIWKGRYNEEVVAIKILSVYRDDPLAQGQRVKREYCMEAVLMKQVDHKNIVTFYGVSTTASDFGLVFPWYKNGNIVDYLKENPDVDRHDLLSGVVSGLQFLHNFACHGTVRPSRVLIDDDGNARLAIAGRGPVVADPGTPFAWDGGLDNYRYLAPEIRFPDAYGRNEILITKECDTYGVAMVIYEVLAGVKPYHDRDGDNVVPKVELGEFPERPPGRINDLVWNLLEKCWSMDPEERPLVGEISSAFSNLSFRPEVDRAPLGQIAMAGELERVPSLAPSSRSNGTSISPKRRLIRKSPNRLGLQLQCIRFSQDQPKGRRFYVKLKYGKQSHTTSLTEHIGHSDEYTWTVRESWVVQQTDVLRRRGQVAFEVFIQAGVLKRDKVCAKGSFFLLDNIHKQIDVDLKEVEGGGWGTLTVSIFDIRDSSY